jgi:hypothetical protein
MLDIDNCLKIGEFDNINFLYTSELKPFQFAIYHKPRSKQTNKTWVPINDLSYQEDKSSFNIIKYDTIDSIIGNSKIIEDYVSFLNHFLVKN